jgi:transmembrane sensor
VTLHEGIIRFRSETGRVVQLVAGQTLAWPEREAPPDAGTPAAPVASAPDAGVRPTVVERLEHIQGLRSRGQWGRAAEEVAALLREPLPSPTRERLSYELGSIFTYQMRNRARACAHWRGHQATYPRGRYRAEVEQAQGSLHCAD